MRDISFAKLLPILLAVLVGGTVGYFIGRSSVTPPPRLPEGAMKEIIQKNPLFKSQSAIFEGEVTKVDGSILTVKDEQGQTGTLTAEANLVVYGTNPKVQSGDIAAQASPSASIALNKKALLTLELINGEYRVTSVQYPPPPPPPAR